MAKNILNSVKRLLIFLICGIAGSGIVNTVFSANIGNAWIAGSIFGSLLWVVWLLEKLKQYLLHLTKQ